MESLIVALAFLLFGLILCMRLIIPRDVMHEVMGDLLADIIKGLWHMIFGARKVRVVEDKRGRLPSLKDRPRR